MSLYLKRTNVKPRTDTATLDLHLAQLKYITHPAKIKAIVAGRGWRKTTTMGILIAQCVMSLVRKKNPEKEDGTHSTTVASRGFIVGRTYKQIETKFLPPVFSIWAKMGIVRYKEETKKGHFIVGKKPPAHFIMPDAQIEDYSRVISFWNGAYIELLSMDRENLNLGGSYDYGAFDEVQEMQEKRVEKEYIISVRSTNFDPNKTLANSIFMSGTMPWTKSGQWIFKYEALANKYPESYFFFMRSSYDNIKSLGKEYFQNLKRILTPMMYAIEIENYRATFTEGGFYPGFLEEKHTYFNTHDYGTQVQGSGINYEIVSRDYNPEHTLELSFDFGGNVSCLLIAQSTETEQRIIDTIIETGEGIANMSMAAGNTTLERLVQRFINAYETHEGEIHLYGDYTGHNRSEKSLPAYQIIEIQLRKAGFRKVSCKAPRSTNPTHSKKYFVIGEILSENNPKIPKIRINAQTCKELILSIQLSPTKDDFQKDKTSERRKLPIGEQTHLSDAFDYLLMAKYSNKTEIVSRSGGGASLGSSRK